MVIFSATSHRKQTDISVSGQETAQQITDHLQELHSASITQPLDEYDYSQLKKTQAG